MIFADFHHNSLLRSLVLLFEKRLGMQVYRPIGIEWFKNGYWAINDQHDTARQFLDIECTQLADLTPPLNIVSNQIDSGIYHVYDPGHASTHKAITFDAFKEMKFEFLIASIPQHIPIFKDLIAKYHPSAKLIVQIGNNWNPEILRGYNVMASVKPMNSQDFNAVYYHQEFDTDIFSYKKNYRTNLINSYINILQHTRQGWDDFCTLESMLPDFQFRSYGGQCRDGNFAGPHDLAQSMHSSDFIFHVKFGGDGYGHVIYNTYACGRAPIIRSSFYQNQLAEELFADDNCIDLDKMSIFDAIDKIKKIAESEELLNEYSLNAHKSFQRSVSFENDAKKVLEWLGTI